MTDTLLVTTRTQRVINNLKEILQKEKNLILYGPPGTGKTWLANRLAKQFTEENDRQQSNDSIASNPITIITFHQSFGYEDFIEGIKPSIQNGKMTFQVQAGIFKQLCRQALNNSSKKFVLIIDEINRGNIAKIFGEVITLIEPSKRCNSEAGLTIKLPYGGRELKREQKKELKRELKVPENLYIIGTMNTADRSIRHMDYALRRRFAFEEVAPNPELLKNIEVTPDPALLEKDSNEKIVLPNVLEALNQRIEVLKGRDYMIGHGYFPLNNTRLTITRLDSIFRTKILPLLEEYFYDEPEKLRWVLGFAPDYFLKPRELDVLGEKRVVYSINTRPFPEKAFLSIYEEKRNVEE